MRISFKLSSLELKAARKVFYGLHTQGERALPWLSFAPCVIFAVSFLIQLFLRPDRSPSFMLLALSPVFLVSGFVSWRQLHEFAAEPDYSHEQMLDVGEDGVFRSTWPGMRVKLPWTKISKYRETGDMFILVSPWPWGAESEPKLSWTTSGRLKPVVLIVPKRAFAAGELEQFRALLDRKLSVWAKSASMRPIVLHSQL
jgi:hypothetical protein